MSKKCFNVTPDLVLSDGERLPFTPKDNLLPLTGDSVVVAKQIRGTQSIGSVRCSVETVFKAHNVKRGPKDGTKSGNAKAVSLAMAAQIVAKGVTGKTAHEYVDDSTTLAALRDCLVQLIGVFGEEQIHNIYKEAANG